MTDAPPAPGSIAELDALPPEPAAVALAPLFEGAPRFLAKLVAQRPFRDASTLFATAERIALGLPEDEAIELIDAHPRLGAPPATVSALSFVEQGYDREAAEVAAADAEARRARTAAELERLNEAYEARFGFRYCVFVAGRPREALLPGLEATLAAERDAELRRALIDVVRIAADRYAKLHPEDAR